MHGSIRTSSCPGCRRSYPLAEVLALVEASGIPRCPECGGVLKPDVVFFGELLPVAELNRASELAGAAGLLLVVGSSLEVYPVAGLPQDTPTRVAASRSSTATRRRSTGTRSSSCTRLPAKPFALQPPR